MTQKLFRVPRDNGLPPFEMTFEEFEHYERMIRKLELFSKLESLVNRAAILIAVVEGEVDEVSAAQWRKDMELFSASLEEKK